VWVLRRDAHWRASLVVLLVALSGPLASAASADKLAPLYAKMKQRFTVNHSGARAGWTFEGALKPIASGRQVPPQRGVDFVFPDCTRLDPGAVRRCRASDQQITRVGPSACPVSSRIGSGSAGLALGATGRLDTKLIVFDGGHRLILVFTTTSGSVVRVLSGTISGTHVKANIPRTVLPSGGEIAVFRFALENAPLAVRSGL
jgi:hypothetical protein